MHREFAIVAAAAAAIQAAAPSVTVYTHRAVEVPENVAQAVDVRLGSAAVETVSTTSIEADLQIACVLTVREAAATLLRELTDLAETVTNALLAAPRNLGLAYVSRIQIVGHEEPVVMGEDLPSGELRLEFFVTYCSDRDSVST